MRTLSAYNTTATDSPYTAPVWLIEIGFDGLDLYLCSGEFGSLGSLCILDGQIYEPALLEVGTITGQKIDPATHKTSPGSFDFAVDNSIGLGDADSFSALFATYDPQFATVDVYLIFDGATATGDKIHLFSGKIDGMPGLSRDKVSVSCSSYEMELSSLFPAEFVSVDTFSKADPDDVGKMMPHVWGSARKVPFLAVKAGAAAPLVSAIDSTDTTLYISDTTGFDSTGTVQIGTEQITYTGLNTSTGAMTGLTRGANSTVAAEHSAGDWVGEVLTEFVYCIGHAVHDITAVFIGETLVDSGSYTAYTGQTGDQLAGYGSRACIKFTALPWIQKQFNISVSDDLDIDDTKDITVDGATRTLIPSGGQAAAYDGSAGTSYTVTNGSWQTIATFPTTNFGAISRAWVHMLAEHNGASGDLDIQVDGSTIGSIPNTYAGVKDEFRFEWSAVGASDWGVEIKAQCDTASETAKIYEIWWEYEYAPSTTTTGAVTLTGGVTGGNSVADTVVGGTVSADVQGYEDDGSGTITGTPNALIERPDHIIEHLLTVVLGLSGVIDSASYAEAATAYGTESYDLGVVVLQAPDVPDLINQMAYQSRSWEFWSAGTHHLVPINAAAADAVITAAMIDMGQVKLSYTPRSDIRNDLTARYSRDWSGYSDAETADRAMVEAEDTVSQTDFGIRIGAQESYPFVTTENQAQDVLYCRLYEAGRPRKMLQVTGGFGLTKFELADVVSFFFTAGDYLALAMLGLVTTDDTWIVTEKQETQTGAMLRLIESPGELEWSESSEAVYTPPGSGTDDYTIYFTGGIGPYTWEINDTYGTGFSLEDTVTIYPDNTLHVASTASGSIELTVTDALGNTNTHYIMSSDGQWTQVDDGCGINNPGGYDNYWVDGSYHWFQLTWGNDRQEQACLLKSFGHANCNICEDTGIYITSGCHGANCDAGYGCDDCISGRVSCWFQSTDGWWECWCTAERKHYKWDVS